MPSADSIRAGRGVDQVPVLVVEDDASLRRAVQRALAEAGARVTAVATGAEALAAAGPGPSTPFAVAALDIGLPDSDGRDVCQALRSRGIEVPVLFLTARGQVDDVLSGFGAGDDYLAKPFHAAELVVRLGALAHRSSAAPAPVTGALQLDPVGHRLLGVEAQPLTPTEYRVLAALLTAPGEVVRRRALVVAGWSHGAQVSDNTLDQYLARLRRKVTAASGGQHQIATVHGVGYRFA